MDYFREGIFNISFIFYAFENLYNPYKNMINEKSKNILENLCKFNNIGKNYEIYKNTINFTYNKSYAEQMYNKFMYAFDEQTNIKLSNCILKFKFGDYFCYLIAMFNQIYSLLLLPFMEKNGSKFNIKKSICNLYNIMHKYGCKNFSLLQFIFQYFKNGNNEFFNAADPNNAKEKILNMSWDIFFYHLTQINVSTKYINCDFKFPYFATMDRKFTMQYRNILKYKGIAIIKKNKETIIYQYQYRMKNSIVF